MCLYIASVRWSSYSISDVLTKYRTRRTPTQVDYSVCVLMVLMSILIFLFLPRFRRENPNDRSAKDVQHLGPATDFYKRLALECSGQQIAVDMFLLNSQYSDLATLCK